MATQRLVSHRYALFVSYLGTRYKGSQRVIARDKSGVQDSIQEALEWALARFLPTQYCRLTASSRTDRGVHALMNCFTLPLMELTCPTEEMKRTANSHLTRKFHDIIINEALLVPTDFHPRKLAVSREYIYRLAVLNDYKSPGFTLNHSPEDLLSHLPASELYKVLPLPCLNLDRAERFLDMIRGERDFASFSHSTKKPENTVRNLEVQIRPVSHDHLLFSNSPSFTFYDVHFKSRAFLYNQIRRTIGALISFATYRICEEKDIQYLLDNPSCDNWGSSMLIAEPWGLYLSKINYRRSAFQEISKRTYKDGADEPMDDLGFYVTDDDSVADD